MADVLKRKYGFSVVSLADATRADILLSLSHYRAQLTENDNLLVFYAGHGWLDKEGDEGYWLPVDAEKDNTLNWISNSSITTILKAMRAKHVLVIADSCYSGKLARGVQIKQKSHDYFSLISKKRARSIIASGGLEPVADSGGKNNHSVFTSALLDALEDNIEIMDGTDLFSKIRKPVMLNADQTPQYSDIRKAGHDGGDFVFLPTN